MRDAIVLPTCNTPQVYWCCFPEFAETSYLNYQADYNARRKEIQKLRRLLERWRKDDVVGEEIPRMLYGLQ